MKRNIIIEAIEQINWKLVIKRILLVLWLVLLIFFGIKIFGGNYFEIMATSENFIKICSWIEKHKILKLLVPFPFYVISNLLLVLIISREKPKKKLLFYLIPIIIIYMIKTKFEIIGSILEIVMYMIISIIYSKRIWRGLEATIITFLFQLISLITKNIGYKLEDENMIISIIYMFDYYIMMIIYYLYSLIRKEGVFMGLFGPFLLSKKVDQLKAYREKLLADGISEEDEKIKEIDEEIKRIEKEESK